MQAGGNVYADMQPHYLYVFCLLMTALGKSAVDIKKQLQSKAVNLSLQK